MLKNDKLLIGKTEKNEEVYLYPNMAMRHGIITGASGSGKTITLKVMAESFSSIGTPVLLVDVKGDLSGCAKEGRLDENINKRVEKLNLENFNVQKFPVVYWDIYGKKGHPISTKISSLGVRLLSKMLLLNDSQEEVLTVCFKIANDEDLELVDLNDLRELLTYISEKRQEYSKEYGNINSQTLTTIQRSVLTLMENGGDCFFKEPELDISDFIKFDSETGYGNINILDATTLFKNPRLYAITLLWILTTLFDKMPEVGEREKPKLVFFIDEAHLLFSEMDEQISKQIVQIVKLIRSKAVGLYFISQSPSDIKEEILGQLGNKVQHVLRSYTKSDEKSLRAAANSYRINKEFDNFEVIKNLGTGEALISFLNEKAEPGISLKTMILPPQSMIGEIDNNEREKIIKESRFYDKYSKKVERETAKDKIKNIKKEIEEKNDVKEVKETKKSSKKSTATKAGEKVLNSTLNTIGRKLGSAIFKGIFKR